jgi:hypothetical protein
MARGIRWFLPLALVALVLGAAACGDEGNGASGGIDETDAQQEAERQERRAERLQRQLARERRERARERRERAQERRAERRRKAQAAQLRRKREQEAQAQTTTPAEPDCHPSYKGACLDPNASDYDCEGGSGDGPEYTGPVTVVGDDPYDLDREGDGLACE